MTTMLLTVKCSGSPGVHFIPYCLHPPAGSGLLRVLWLWLFLTAVSSEGRGSSK